MIIRFIVCLSMLLMSTGAHARPVSYPGGVTLITENSGDRYAGLVHYSPTARYALGYRAEYWREDDFYLHSLQVNNLLQRWNTKNSQANLYLKSGLGLATTDRGAFDSERDLAGFTGLAADWETRRYYVSYANRYTEAGDIADNFRQTARLGVAPYIAEYGDLHTWLMLEVRHAPESEDKVTVTPLVRIFKGTHLVEGGISDQGDVLFNWTIRY